MLVPALDLRAGTGPQPGRVRWSLPAAPASPTAFEDQESVGYYGFMATPIPHLEPDPFDKVVEKVLSDCTLLHELDEQHAAIDRGDAKLHSHDQARRMVGFLPKTPRSRRLAASQ